MPMWQLLLKRKLTRQQFSMIGKLATCGPIFDMLQVQSKVNGLVSRKPFQFGSLKTSTQPLCLRPGTSASKVEKFTAWHSQTKLTAAKAFQDDFNSNSIQKRRNGVPNFDYSGVYWLLLANGLLFLADHVLHFPWASSLYLYHAHPRWWQYLTCSFMHGSWQHLSNNAFMLLIFGRIVEEEEGTFGVWATYVLCAIGSSIASVLMQPRNMVSVGASGAVFGMFAVSVLTKLQFRPRKLLEFAILGQFVLQQLSNVWSGGKGLVIAGTQVGHLAHLAGAFAGVLLVFALSKIPAPAE